MIHRLLPHQNTVFKRVPSYHDQTTDSSDGDHRRGFLARFFRSGRGFREEYELADEVESHREHRMDGDDIGTWAVEPCRLG